MLPSEERHESSDAQVNEYVAKRILLVGWDGGDTSTLRSLLADGRLPSLNRLIGSGSYAELAIPGPPISPSIWTSLATGRHAHEHGILCGQEADLSGKRLQPITRRSRESITLWNLLNAAGLRTNVVGWPVSHPAEALAGICVSDFFATPFPDRANRIVHGPAVSPVEAVTALKSRLVLPAQVEEIAVGQVMPKGATSLPQYAQFESLCRTVLAETSSLFRAVRWCLDGPKWEFTAVVFSGLRRCSEIAQWMQQASPDAAELSGAFVAGCYEHHDMLLGQLLDEVGNDTHVITVAVPDLVPAARVQQEVRRIVGANRKLGWAAIIGPGVCHRPIPSRGSILDLVPTVLAMLGIDISKDLPGKTLHDWFATDLKPRFIEPRPRNVADGIARAREGNATDGGDANEYDDQQELVAHLVALGYVDPQEVAAVERMKKCQKVAGLNRAHSLLDAGQLPAAITCLEALLNDHPDSYSIRASLAKAYLRAKKPQAAREHADYLMTQGMETPQLFLLSAEIEFAKRHYDAALEELRCTRRSGTVLYGVSTLEGDIWLRKGNITAAEHAYQMAIEADGPSSQSLDGMASVHLQQGRYEEAAVSALDALTQDMRFGRAHYHLAMALARLEHPDEAIRALENWAALEPLSAAPYRWMARIFEQKLGDATKGAASRARGREVVRQRRHVLEALKVVDASTPSFAK